MSITSFRDLEAWKVSHALVISIYKLTKTFPLDEQFGLTPQLRRAAVSITSNIAEGFGRTSWKEKAQFYSMAHGSLCEIQNQLDIARDLSYCPLSDYDILIQNSIQASKLINGLIKSTRRA